MADETLSLDEIRKASGRVLLEMTDKVGFGALGAAWVYNREADLWWFLLVSPMMDTKGPLWIYQRFLQIFQKWQLPEGITPMDIRVVSPKEASFRTFPFHIPPDGGTIELKDVTIDGMNIDYMSIYRMNRPTPRPRDNSKIFDHQVRQFLAA